MMPQLYHFFLPYMDVMHAAHIPRVRNAARQEDEGKRVFLKCSSYAELRRCALQKGYTVPLNFAPERVLVLD